MTVDTFLLTFFGGNFCYWLTVAMCDVVCCCRWPESEREALNALYIIAIERFPPRTTSTSFWSNLHYFTGKCFSFKMVGNKICVTQPFFSLSLSDLVLHRNRKIVPENPPRLKSADGGIPDSAHTKLSYCVCYVWVKVIYLLKTHDESETDLSDVNITTNKIIFSLSTSARKTTTATTFFFWLQIQLKTNEK